MGASTAFLIAQEADQVEAAHRDPRHEVHEKANEHRDDLAPPSRFHYHPSWTWFTVGCGLLGLFSLLVAAYTPFVFATGIYSEPDVVLRNSFHAIFWMLPCYLILQVVFYLWCQATLFQRPLLKEALWTNVLKPAACAILGVFLVRLNAAGGGTDLDATLVTAAA